MSVTIREFTDEYTETRRRKGMVHSIEVANDKYSVVIEEWDDGDIVTFWGGHINGINHRVIGFLSAQAMAISWVEKGSRG